MARRKLDFYETPHRLTHALLRRVYFHGTVLEPCSGDGAIADVLVQYGLQVVTSDLDPERRADRHGDATDPAFWDELRPDWVVTNPPFSMADRILPLAYARANLGVAMLLRLSYLEPCKGRDEWLAENPPQKIIVLPRTRFVGKGTDMVTVAWMIWSRHSSRFQRRIEIVTRKELGQLDDCVHT